MTAVVARSALAAAMITAPVACAGGSAGSSSSSTTSPVVQVSPVPTLPAGKSAPAALRHGWADVSNDQVQLSFGRRTYTIRIGSGGAPLVARTSFHGADMWAMLRSGGSCQGLAHYRWSIIGSRLRFHKVSDECAGRADIFARTFARVSG